MSNHTVLQNNIASFDLKLMHFWTQIISEHTVSFRAITLSSGADAI